MLASHEVLTDFTAWQKILTKISDHRLEKPPPRIASRPILVYFEFRGKPYTATVIWMDPHSHNKLIATKYCFSYSGMIPVSFSFFMLCCLFLTINFYMFRDVPECSGIFRVPNFIDSRFRRREQAVIKIKWFQRTFTLKRNEIWSHLTSHCHSAVVTAQTTQSQYT